MKRATNGRIRKANTVIKTRQDLSHVQRAIVKIGSSLLTDTETGIRMSMVEHIAAQVHAMQQMGVQVSIVSSGAVAIGCVHLGWLGKTLSVHEKQAAAAVGQSWLMQSYGKAFAKYNTQVAQMLLTKDDLRHRRRYLNASNTSETLFSAGVIPIVNENDTVVVEEIKFGDNDNLGALVALMVNADLLVMMTDVDGLYDANPNQYQDAKRCSMVDDLNDDVMAMAGDSDSEFGTGGMLSKLTAAKIATRGGVVAAIVNGQQRHVLIDLFSAKDVGTLFLCGEDRHSRHQHWIADVLHVAGQLHVDAGAAQAIVHKGASLLPIGMIDVQGDFDKGECVEVVADSMVIARGLCNYNSKDLRRVQGLSSKDMAKTLGYKDFTSVIHRDNLVLKVRGKS
ncbi:MAG: glutamate 5-kinase [Mariprofundaceae bacterium]|nr:glutamate 5-kinase [Mariprofundaceae bacterium]